MSPDLHHLSGAYVVDALDVSERASFEQHLATCPDCRAEVAELREAAHTLGALADAEPPARLRSAVLDGIAQVRPLPPVVDPTTSATPLTGGADGPGSLTPVVPVPSFEPAGATVVPFLRRTTTWFAAAAAAAILTVGGLVWSPWQGDTGTLSALDQVRTAQDAATKTASVDGMSATLAYSRQLGRSALSVDGLPPAPSGKTYQLWYIGSDKVAHPAGFLRASGEGAASAVLDGDVNSASAVGVTVEPAGGSAAPTTNPIMVMNLA